MQDIYEGLKLDNQLCFPLYAASREVVKKYHPFLSELDITYTQYVAMMVMWEEGRISVGDLGSRLFLDSGTMTPLLKALEKKGYVTRKRSETDERMVMVTVTEAGMELRERAVEVPAKVGACMAMDPEEAAMLYRILYKILGREVK